MLRVYDVADYMLYRAAQSDEPITHMKLQKLCYYAQAYHLALLQTPLFREPLHAWDYGPVVRELWDRYRYRREALPAPEGFNPELIPAEQREVMDAVFERYRGIHALELSRQTHQEDPWREAWANARAGQGDNLSPETMSIYFESRLWELETTEAPPPLSREQVIEMLSSNPQFAEQTNAAFAN